MATRFPAEKMAPSKNLKKAPPPKTWTHESRQDLEHHVPGRQPGWRGAAEPEVTPQAPKSNLRRSRWRRRRGDDVDFEEVKDN